MAWARFGYTQPDDELPIELWMDDQGDQGFHFIPRRAKFSDQVFGVALPDSIAGKSMLPKRFMESSWNVYRPTDISWEEANRFLFANDDHAYGGSMPGHQRGEPGWSGHRLKYRRNPLPVRVWNSAPPKLKNAVAGGGSVGGLVVYDLSGGDRSE